MKSFLPPALGSLALALFCLALPARGDVLVTVEARTLDHVLEQITAQSTQVSLGEMQLRIVAEEISIARLVPERDDREGYVELRLRLHAPDLGMRVPLEPKLYFEVVESGGATELELTFRDVKIALPTGPIDVSSLMPTLRYPAASLFQLEGADGPVELVTTLSDVFVAPEGLRMVLEVAAR